jgi:hypothetical protein
MCYVGCQMPVSLAWLGFPLLSFALLTPAACQKPAAVPAPATVAVDAAKPVVAAAPVPPAKRVFDEWLRAQLYGDFAAYQALYADSFQAVVPSGRRARTVKRAAWMSEHKRKFGKPMTVDVSDTRLWPVGDGFEARFHETWESGTYHEETDKVMTFAQVDGAWRITKEEVSAKQVDAAKGSAMSSMAFLFVWENEPVILSDAADDGTVGRPRMRDDSADTAVKAVDEKRLQSDLRQWKHEKLVLFDEKLEECTTTVTGFEMITVSEWDMGTIESQIEGKRTKAAIAAKVWEGTHQLVARTDGLAGACERPVLARPARLPKLKLHAFEAADDKIATQAAGLLKAIPSVAARAEEAKKNSPDWDDTPRVTVASLGKAGSLVTAAVGAEDCGGPGYDAVAIWRTEGRDGKGAWHLVRSPKEGDGGDDLTPLLAFDLDDDGTFEILFRDEIPNRLGLLRWRGEDYAITDVLNIPYSDCRC